MRIIAGRLRGRRLASPTWQGLRPTSDRLRETLFNVLGSRVEGARVLDLCAGTGAVGLEALSRGAAHVTIVDVDARACRLAAANLATCGVQDGCAIVRSSVDDAAAQLRTRFDIVFLDPPYYVPDLARFVAAAADLVAPGGLLVVEHGRARDAGAAAGRLHRTRELRSGDSTLSFYRSPDGSDEPVEQEQQS